MIIKNEVKLSFSDDNLTFIIRVYAIGHDGAHRKRLWTHSSPWIVSSTIGYTTIFDVFGLFIVSSKMENTIIFLIFGYDGFRQLVSIS